MKHIVLVGAMGVGKTTVGREVARRLGRPFLDSDSEIEDVHGETGAEIAERDGVERLHSIELQILDDLLGNETPSVIAPAASVVDTAGGRDVLAKNLTLWLDAPEGVLSIRRHEDDHRRNVDLQEVRELERRRRPIWEDLGLARVDTSGSVEEAVETVIREVERLESGQNRS